MATTLNLRRERDRFGGVTISSDTVSAYSDNGIVFSVFDRLTLTRVHDAVARGDVPYVIADILGISGGRVDYRITDVVA